MRLTVADVHKRLIKRGFRFDKKTLYRLASPAPLHRIDASVMGAICADGFLYARCYVVAQGRDVYEAP